MRGPWLAILDSVNIVEQTITNQVKSNGLDPRQVMHHPLCETYNHGYLTALYIKRYEADNGDGPPMSFVSKL